MAVEIHFYLEIYYEGFRSSLEDYIDDIVEAAAKVGSEAKSMMLDGDDLSQAANKLMVDKQPKTGTIEDWEDEFGDMNIPEKVFVIYTGETSIYNVEEVAMAVAKEMFDEWLR